MKKITFFIFIALLVSCSATEEFYDDITAPDYVSSSKAKRLEVPPDLSEIEQSDNYSVPGEAKSYKDYLDREENFSSSKNEKITKKLITNPQGMKIVKSGNLRWLVVNKEPDLIWPHVKDFWEELGFRVMVANKRTGIIETEWMDSSDLKLDANQSALSNFDKWLDSLSGFGDKRKFRTRVEYGENDTTEIFVSQRSAEAAADQHSRILRTRESGYNPSTVYQIPEYKADDSANQDKISVSETRKLNDLEIDSELLTRMMIKLGASDLDAKNKIKNPEILIKAELQDKKNEAYINMLDPYDRSWRRLGLALDIIGFLIEDKNRSDGIYYVRFSEIELPKEVEIQEDKGIIDSLIFWDDDSKKEIDEDDISDIEITEDKIINEEDKKFTGIEAPEIRPIDEDYTEEDLKKDYKKSEEEETWLGNLWPSWGSEEEKDSLPDNEKRYRIRIKPTEENLTKVYLDFPNGKKNNSPEARKILKIIFEHLK